MPGLQGQEQSWDGNRAQALQGPDGFSMAVAETPAQAQDTTFLQERLLMLTQVGQDREMVSPAGNPGYQMSQAMPTCAREQRSRGTWALSLGDSEVEWP